jgi:hypothetical protein
MNYRSRLKVVILVLFLLVTSSATQFGKSSAAKAGNPADNGQAKDVYETQIAPFLKKHCFACHGNGKSKADLSFDIFKNGHSVVSARETWNSVRHVLEVREMPPKGKPMPDDAEIEAVQKSIRDIFDEYDRTAAPNVGRVTIRRLNRTEYNNTVRDLLGVDFKLAENFPADDVGYGFDNIGDVLTVSPLLLEKYLSAAEMIFEQVM